MNILNFLFWASVVWNLLFACGIFCCLITNTEFSAGRFTFWLFTMAFMIWYMFQ